ncbi:MAG: hypothetical protein J6U49_02135 [Alistipes sp.]|nr:hypothetical protein [Alistipes sp.]
MNSTTAKQLVARLNTLMPRIKGLINDTLGVPADFTIWTAQRSNGTVVCASEAGTDTRSQLLATPLLRHIFKDGSLRMRFDLFNDTIYCTVSIEYAHPNGGGNGRELMSFEIDQYDNIQ